MSYSYFEELTSEKLKSNIGDLVYITRVCATPNIRDKYARIRQFDELYENVYVVIEGYYSEGELEVFKIPVTDVWYSSSEETMPNKNRMQSLVMGE